MKRISWVLASILLAIPGAALAQSPPPAAGWDLTLQLGVHADRLDQPERVNRQIIGGDVVAEAYTGKGEAPTLGLRATRWLSGHFGADLGVELAHNRSWYGGSVGADLPTFRKLTLFSSVAPVWRVFSPASRMQLQLGAGPALVTHSGSGESLLTRSTDVGLMGMADASVPVSPRLRLTLGAQNYHFRSSFLSYHRADGGYDFPAGARSRSEWVIQSGLRLSF